MECRPQYFGPRLGLCMDMFGSSKNVIRAERACILDNQLRGYAHHAYSELPASLTLSRGDSADLR